MMTAELRFTYIAGDIVHDDTLLLGYTAGLASGRDAKGARLSDRVFADGRVRRAHVLGKHGVLVELSDAG